MAKGGDAKGGDDHGTEPRRRQIAVALSYDPAGNAEAPKVVASGRGKVAEQILELAFAKGIKVREDGDLAEVLAAVEVDSVIPLSAFMAVAEILAYVYRANGQDLPPDPRERTRPEA